MTVESLLQHSMSNGTTYRFYVNMVDATDQFSAVYGTNEDHLDN